MTHLYRTTVKVFFPLAILTLMFLISPGAARADTLTFSIFEQAGTNLVHIADPYFESGYRISNGGELYYAQQSNSLYAGSAGLHERIGNGLLTLSRTDGNPFTLTSINLSVLSPVGTSPAVVFTGVLAGGGTVTQTFTPTVFGFQTFVFSSVFTNLLSVSWHQGCCETSAHQFDNIVVSSSVPEPTTMILLGTGLVGVAARARKRQKQMRS